MPTAKGRTFPVNVNQIQNTKYVWNPRANSLVPGTPKRDPHLGTRDSKRNKETQKDARADKYVTNKPPHSVFVSRKFHSPTNFVSARYRSSYHHSHDRGLALFTLPHSLIPASRYGKQPYTLCYSEMIPNPLFLKYTTTKKRPRDIWPDPRGYAAFPHRHARQVHCSKTAEPKCFAATAGAVKQSKNTKPPSNLGSKTSIKDADANKSVTTSTCSVEDEYDRVYYIETQPEVVEYLRENQSTPDSPEDETVVQNSFWCERIV